MWTQSQGSRWYFAGFFSFVAAASVGACQSGGADPAGAGGGTAGEGGQRATGAAAGHEESKPTATGGSGGQPTSAAGGHGAGGAGEEPAGEGGAPPDGTDGCASGTFDHDGDLETSCLPWSECVPGEFVLEAGSEDADVICAPCAAGTFSGGWFDGRSGPTSCTPCDVGTFSSEGAARCRSHRECDWSEVRVAAGTATTDTVCDAGSVLRQFGTAAEDAVRAVAGGPDGGVYVAGGTTGVLGAAAVGQEDSFLRRYDASGHVLWTRQFGFAEADRVEHIAVARGGQIVVVGTVDDASRPGGAATYLQRFDSAGELVSVADVPAEPPCLARRVAVETQGDSVVAGVMPRVNVEGGVSDWDACVQRYDASGALVWSRSAGSTAEESTFAVAMVSGQVVVAGSTAGAFASESAGGLDAFLWLPGATSAEDRFEQFGTAADESVTAAAAVLGGFALAGWTGGSLGGDHAGAEDVFVREYRTPMGGQTSPATTLQLGTAAREVPTALAAGSAGLGVAVRVEALDTGAPSDGRLVVIRGGSAAVELNFGSSAADTPTSVAWGPASQIFVGGVTEGDLGAAHLGLTDAFVARFDTSNGALFTRR